MHLVGKRQRSSKIYMPFSQSIPMSNDRSHESLTTGKVEEAKHVQEKKQIDKIMHGVIRERMFSNFVSQDTRLSVEQYQTIDLIHKHSLHPHHSTRHPHRTRRHRPLPQLPEEQPIPAFADTQTLTRPYFHSHRPSPRHTHTTLNPNRPTKLHPSHPQTASHAQRTGSQRLPKLKEEGQGLQQGRRGQLFHPKKFAVNEKAMMETFRKWAGSAGSGTLVHELKVSRQSLISRFKGQVDGKLLERFLLFFGFPGWFGLRQFCGLLEAAGNCNLKFIYFWVFSLLDENANGILTGQDFFEFLQRFATSNFYVEAEIYQIQNELTRIEQSFVGGEEGETYVQEMLAMNHGLRLQEVKNLLKQSNKQRIAVSCVKNTCYHQTVLSLDHDPLERIKQDQLEHNQLASQKQQLNSEARRTLLTTPGIRLRHFYSLFAGRRPKIFCYFLHLLTGVPPQDYE